MVPMIYLVHFSEPYRHASHYGGFCDTSARDPELALDTRLDYHRKGRGSRLLKAVTEAGIGFEVARIWPDGTRTQERLLKAHSWTRLCPVCSGRAALRRGLLGAPTASHGTLVDAPPGRGFRPGRLTGAY